MGLFSKIPSPTIDDLTQAVSFSEYQTNDMELRHEFLPAEWFPQSGVQLTWPHAHTDWKDVLPEVTECYLQMAFAIASRELLLVVTPEPELVEALFKARFPQSVCQNVRWMKCDTNDTWARDHGFITLINEMGARLMDFRFNGWGMKFAANFDNQINRRLMEAKALNGCYDPHLDFTLEGGSIESDGKGTLLTTAECLLSPNRNDFMDAHDIEEKLKSMFHVEQVLWLHHGYLAGDDTDSHIDTLARLCPNNAIAYVKCNDTEDEHFTELKKMEDELRTFRTLEGEPFKLIPLPMPNACYAETEEGTERIPATYANFLVINDAVLYPTYQQPDNDQLAAQALQEAFPKYEIIGIDCRILIRQHGSLHCCTMQFPKSVLK